MLQIDWPTHTLVPLLAQEGATLPPPPGAGGAPPAGDGTTQSASGPGGPAPMFNNSFLGLVLLMVVAMIVFSLLGQRRDRKRRQAMLSAIKKHDRVQTTGGVIGSVVELKSDTVVLKVDESSNTRITFARNAIQQVLGSGPEGAAPLSKVE